MHNRDNKNIKLLIHSTKTTHTTYIYNLYHRDSHTCNPQRRKRKIKNNFKRTTDTRHAT